MNLQRPVLSLRTIAFNNLPSSAYTKVGRSAGSDSTWRGRNFNPSLANLTILERDSHLSTLYDVAFVVDSKLCLQALGVQIGAGGPGTATPNGSRI